MTTQPPKPETIESLTNGAYSALAMLAGMQLDVFSCLKDGPMPSEEIASALGVGNAKLEPLLYALASAKLLAVEGNLFTNSPEADHFLLRDCPAYIGGRHGALKDRWSAVFKTAESVLTGLAQARLDFSAMSPEDQIAYRRSRYSECEGAARDLVRRYDFSK